MILPHWLKLTGKYTGIGLLAFGLYEGAKWLLGSPTAVTHVTSGGATPPGVPPVVVPSPAGPVPAPIAAPVIQVPPQSQIATAAATFLQYLNQSGVSASSTSACRVFQNSFNLTSPPTLLQTDGIYGAKTQAALQGCIAPATAPQNAIGGTVIPSGPPAATPNPSLVNDVSAAAQALLAMGSPIPESSNSTVSAFQTAYNSHPVAAQLVVDGKYGPKTQVALQSVLDWIENGDTAPTGGYGATSGTNVNVPAFNS